MVQVAWGGVVLGGGIEEIRKRKSILTDWQNLTKAWLATTGSSVCSFFLLKAVWGQTLQLGQDGRVGGEWSHSQTALAFHIGDTKELQSSLMILSDAKVLNIAVSTLQRPSYHLEAWVCCLHDRRHPRPPLRPQDGTLQPGGGQHETTVGVAALAAMVGGSSSKLYGR